MRWFCLFVILWTVAACAGQPAAPVIAMPQTPVEACNFYSSSITRAVVMRRIESGQIPESRADEFMVIDTQLGEYCAALADTPGADVMAAYRAFALQLALLASDSIG